MPQVHYLGVCPVCATPTENGTLVGSGTFYPVGFTLQEFCYLYWKVKGFYFNGTSTVPNGSGGTTTYTYNGCLPIDQAQQQYAFNPQSELDLICNWSQTQAYIYLAERWQLILFFGGLINFPNLYLYNNLYWPFLQIQTPGNDSGNLPTEQSPTAFCTFLGKRIDMFGSPDLSLTITPCSEWPYNP
jgi:hypothetical protein